MPRKNYNNTVQTKELMYCIGYNLRKIRKSRGYSQQCVADYLKINRTTYTKYETGASQMPYETMSRLAMFYNVDYNTLLCYDAMILIDKELYDEK